MTNQLIKAITKEFADRGKTIEGGWQALLAVSIPYDAPDIQKEEMRKAFYLGAQHLFASILTILDPSGKPTEKDFARMNSIHKELEEFTRTLRVKQN